MIQVLHKLLALILAFVVLFSSFSFTVEKHICMGEVTSTSYFTEVDSCGMIMEEEDCVNDDFSQENVRKEKCCTNVHEIIPGNQNEQQAIDKYELSQLQFVLAFTYSYLNLFEESSEEISFHDYSPPWMDKDKQVLYQTFLI